MTKFPISSSALTANRRKRETNSPKGQAGPTHQEAPSFDGRIEAVPVDQMIPYAGNARKHSRQQVAQLAAATRSRRSPKGRCQVIRPTAIMRSAMAARPYRHASGPDNLVIQTAVHPVGPT